MSSASDVTRIVLLKPGDVLCIGNLGPMGSEDCADLYASLANLKESIGLHAVAVFEADIDLAALTPTVVAGPAPDHRG